MSLNEKLDAKKEAFQSSAPAEALQVMGRALKELNESGIMDRVVAEGNRAPDFSLVSAGGERVDLAQRLATGPVVLGFYRGRW